MNGLGLAVVILIHLADISIKPILSLRCFTCTTRWQYSDCVRYANQSSVQICDSSQPYCMVRRSETSGMFTSLFRGCVSKCRQHCGVWGDDVDVEICYSCCDYEFCNTDNSANQKHIHLPHLFVFVYITFLLVRLENIYK